MSLNDFEEKINGSHADQINLMRDIHLNENFFKNVGDDYVYKPWINFIINKNQESFDQFADSDLSWKYMRHFDYKLKSNGLRQEKLSNVNNLIMYEKLLHNYDCHEELPINFIEHYLRVSDAEHKLFWDFIKKNDIDRFKLYLQYHDFNPKLLIEKEYGFIDKMSNRNYANSKSNSFERLKRNIEMHFDDYVKPKIFEGTNFDLIKEVFAKSEKTDFKSIMEIIGGMGIKDENATIFKSIEVTEDNILQITWRIKEDGNGINYLPIADYFEFMSLSERTEWWYRIENIPEEELNTIMIMSLSEVFLDYAENVIDKMDLSFPAKILLMSEQFINRFLKKKPESKDNLIKYAMKHNISLLHYLIPDATSDDILKYLE